MLRMISRVSECCGYAGKDQLAYNTEFSVIDGLITKLYQKIKLNSQQPIFVGIEPEALVEVIRKAVFTFSTSDRLADDLTSVAIRVGERQLPLHGRTSRFRAI